MLKRFILWDFPRATWQYDVMVGIILAFIFLTPRAWFSDQPRIPQAISVDVATGHPATNVFWVEPELLTGVPAQQQATRMAEIIRSRTGNKRLHILRVETIYDSEREVKGYLALVKP